MNHSVSAKRSTCSCFLPLETTSSRDTLSYFPMLYLTKTLRFRGPVVVAAVAFGTLPEFSFVVCVYAVFLALLPPGRVPEPKVLWLEASPFTEDFS